MENMEIPIKYIVWQSKHFAAERRANTLFGCEAQRSTALQQNTLNQLQL